MKIIEMILSIIHGGLLPKEANSQSIDELITIIFSVIYKIKDIDISFIVLSLLDDISKPMNTTEILERIKSLFPSLNKILANRLRSFLFNRDGYLKENLIETSDTSMILKYRIDLFLLPLLIPDISMNVKLKRLYVGSKDGLNFVNLYKSFKYYNANTIILIKHINEESKSDSILGVYNEGEIIDIPKFSSGVCSNSFVI